MPPLVCGPVAHSAVESIFHQQVKPAEKIPNNFISL